MRKGIAVVLAVTGSLFVGPAALAAPVTPQHAGHDHGKKSDHGKKHDKWKKHDHRHDHHGDHHHHHHHHHGDSAHASGGYDSHREHDTW